MESLPRKPKECKYIKGFEGLYAVTKDGKVWSGPKSKVGKYWSTKSRWMKQKTDRYGYKVVELSRKSYTIHRLVALTYIPNPLNKKTVNHKNSIKDDNRVSNLEWMTNKENLQHASENGLLAHGERNSKKLTNDDVRNIRATVNQVGVNNIAKHYSIDRTTVWKITTFRSWKKIT